MEGVYHKIVDRLQLSHSLRGEDLSWKTVERVQSPGQITVKANTKPHM